MTHCLRATRSSFCSSNTARETLGVEPVADTPRPAEDAAIAEQETALSNPDWTHRQGRKLVELGVKIAAGTHLTESAHKARGGLIRANLVARDGAVADLMLSGDITCLPEDGIDRLSASLAGVALRHEELVAAATSAIGELALDIPGVEPADIATVVMNAVEAGD